MLKYSMILTAIDRVTAPAKRIRASMQGIGKAAKAMGADVRKAGSEAVQVTRLDRVSRRLAGAFAIAGRAAKHWAGRAGIGSFGDAAEKVGFGVGRLIRSGIGKAFTAVKWGAGALGAGAGFSLVNMFQVASQFEQYQIMLENMEGSNAAAKKSFAWVKDFAATTPYELDQVMEAFVQLKAYGIEPMNGTLRAAGDAAAGMSKPIMQAVEAIADAMTGENERLKEFGIRASKQGDKIAYTYRKNGKDITRTVKGTGSEIEKALTGIFNDRFGGMMQRQSGTMAGMLSNLKDLWSSFLMKVAEAGIFDRVKNAIKGILDQIAIWAKDGTLDRWAKTISESLVTAFDWGVKFVRGINWPQLGRDLQTAASAAVTLANAIVTIATWSGRIGQGARVIYAPGSVANDIVPQTPSGGKPLWDMAKDWWNRPKPKTGPPASRLGPPMSRPAPARKTAANDVSGTIRIQVEGKNGAQVRTASVQSSNRNVGLKVVNIGRTMSASA